MKYINKIAGLMLVFALLISCVSTKKYDELMLSKKQSEEALEVNNGKYQSLKTEADKLSAEIKRLKESTSQALEAKQER